MKGYFATALVLASVMLCIITKASAQAGLPSLGGANPHLSLASNLSPACRSESSDHKPQKPARKEISLTQLLAQNDSSLRQQTGFYHQLHFALLFGKGNTNESVGVLSGYQFGRHFALGLGLNLDLYQKSTALPVYLQPRLYLFNRKAGVYAFSDVGWGFAWRNHNWLDEFMRIKARGGLMGQIGTACQINYNQVSLNFALGYKLQKTLLHYEQWIDEYDPESGEIIGQKKIMDVKEDRLYKRVVFTMGIIF